MYYVYILTCNDGTLYTGITNDITNRMEIHKSGKGSKYVRARMPFVVSYIEECETKSIALKRELEIKSMSKVNKKKLLASF